MWVKSQSLKGLFMFYESVGNMIQFKSASLLGIINDYQVDL